MNVSKLQQLRTKIADANSASAQDVLDVIDAALEGGGGDGGGGGVPQDVVDELDARVGKGETQAKRLAELDELAVRVESVEALEPRVTAVEKGAEDAVSRETVGDLESRIAALEQPKA